MYNLELERVMYRNRLTAADNSIANSLTTCPALPHLLICANNDKFVDVLDVSTCQSINRFNVDFAVNVSACSLRRCLRPAR